SGLLVGLEETRGSVLCLYELGLSRVVKAVVIPGRITAIEPLVSYGGASTSTQHLHQSLRWFFGIAAVATDLGHVLLVDLCLDDLSCSQCELEASDLQVVTKSPADIPGLREVSTREGRHLCLQLNPPGSVGVTALQYISRTNQLAVGFSDGHLQLWNMKTLKKEAQATNTRLLSCQTIEKFRAHPDRDDSMNEGAPLFNSSSNFTDPQTLQLLQHTQKLLSNLSAIFHCLLNEAQELTQQGLAGLMNKNMVSCLISKYAQVVLWFCRTGLLPEGSDCLMIDGLVGQCGERLTNLWKRDEGGTGQYPPPTLHVIYLLLDVMYSFPNKDGTSVESFPTAFAIPIGLVKLVQGLWLLDHNDHQSSFDLLLHPAASQFHFKWQHERVLQALMCQGQQSVALRYFHVTKPLITSTTQAKLCLSVLLHNRCLIEAWCLLRQHSNRLNITELLGFLYESCQELGLIKELLKLPLGLNEQPLSTITKRPANEKVMSRAGFINSVFTKIEEVCQGREVSPQSSPAKTLIDLVVHPSCETPQPLLSPARPPSSWVSPKSIRRAPELSLLQTPQIVKRARALAASGPVFSAFTPQSILRSSLRPTPVATPSASPGRSITPPLRSKESRITFIEEAETVETQKGIRWINGVNA
ncbi:hypothetical protein GOODEAATRI_008529, partial [Goodea atripinnis]